MTMLGRHLLESGQLRDGIDRIFKILGDPEFRGDEKATQRRAAVSRIATDLFDFGEMSKRTLGRHWDERTPAERLDFARLFTDEERSTWFAGVTVASIGPITAATAAEHGFTTTVMPSDYTIPALAQALARHFGARGARAGAIS